MPSYSDIHKKVVESAGSCSSDAAFFCGGGRSDALENLKHFSIYSDLVLILSAPAGAGKSFLLEKLCEQLPSDHEAFLVKAEVSLTPPLFLNKLKSYFGCERDSNSTWLAQQFSDLGARKRSLSIIIDQAEALDKEIVSWLLKVYSQIKSNSWPVHILFSGCPVFYNELSASPYFDRSQVHHIELLGLSIDDARSWLSFYFKAKQADTPSLSDSQLKEYLAASDGNLSTLVDLVVETMVKTKQSRKEVVKMPHWQKVVLGCTILMLLGVAILHLTKGPAVQQVEVPLDISTKNAVVTAPLNLVETASTNPATQNQGAVERPQPSYDKPQAKLLENGATSDELHGIGKTLVTTADKEEKAKHKEEKTAQEYKAGPIIASSEEPKKTSVKANDSNRSKVASLSYNWNWLKQQRGSGFVIQLLGSSSRSGVEKLISGYPNERLLLLQSERNGKPWYILVSGYYGSRSDALAASKQLPKALAPTSPWIRTLASLKKESAHN